MIDKEYKPASSYVVMERWPDGNGNYYTVPVVHEDPARWAVMVKTPSGEVLYIGCEPTVYYQANHGDRFPYITRLGGITRIPYFRHGLQESEY